MFAKDAANALGVMTLNVQQKGSQMIWHPKPGMTVELRYQASNRKTMPHGARGVIVVASKGPGPINAAVKIGDETLIVPRGNLKEEK